MWHEESSISDLADLSNLARDFAQEGGIPKNYPICHWNASMSLRESKREARSHVLCTGTTDLPSMSKGPSYSSTTIYGQFQDWWRMLSLRISLDELVGQVKLSAPFLEVTRSNNHDLAIGLSPSSAQIRAGSTARLVLVTRSSIS